MSTKPEFALPVHKTEDYSSFSKLTGNRELNKNHVRRLYNVVVETPEFTKKNPIVVNERMEVIDGQHRIAAHELVAEREGTAYPIYYVVKEGFRVGDAKNLNIGTRMWNVKDFARLYALEGRAPYKIFQKYVEKYPEFGASILITALAGEETHPKSFVRGLFEVANEKKADTPLRQVSEAHQVVGTKTRNTLGPSRAFGFSFMRVAQHPRYDHQRMLEQLEKHKLELHSVPQTREHLAGALNLAYNLGRSDKVDLLIRE